VNTMCIDSPSGPPRTMVPKIQQDLACAFRCDARVLITGESGVGTRALARLIHRNSRRAAGQFLTIDCAAIPDVLLESKLFGHARDSVHGLDRDTRGVLEFAHGGTIFMANIGAIGLTLQARLLQFLEHGEIRRVGADLPHAKVDVRVISSADGLLFEQTELMTFRADLYYRLNVMHLVMPPMRRRRQGAGDGPPRR
jgi:transcriptional regulator with PAS, ATPase and Fis domain